MAALFANVASAQAVLSGMTDLDTARADTNLLHETTVIAGDAHVIVSRRVGKPVWLKVETNAGTFGLTADSAVIATVADSVAALPDLPAPSEKQHKPASTKFWGLQGAKDKNTTFRFSRTFWNSHPDIELDLSNGAWETFELLGDQASNVLLALRGMALDTTDTAHIRVETRCAVSSGCPGTPYATANEDTMPGHAPHTERHASPFPDNPRPSPVFNAVGRVVMQFVIDTTGKVDRRTIMIVRSDNPRLARAVISVLPLSRFHPAQVDGRKVKELVEQPFQF